MKSVGLNEKHLRFPSFFPSFCLSVQPDGNWQAGGLLVVRVLSPCPLESSSPHKGSTESCLHEPYDCCKSMSICVSRADPGGGIECGMYQCHEQSPPGPNPPTPCPLPALLSTPPHPLPPTSPAWTRGILCCARGCAKSLALHSHVQPPHGHQALYGTFATHRGLASQWSAHDAGTPLR